jgi:MFS family permease
MTAGTRWRPAWILSAAFALMIIDETAVTVALPSIQTDLALTSSDVAWVLDAYLIALGSVLLLAGRLADLTGHARVLLAGLAMFSSASLLCGVAPAPQLLIAGRWVQGLGAALVSAAAFGLVATLYPHGRDRVRAIAIYGFGGSAGGGIGLAAGGVITQAVGWHAVFLVNPPIGVALGLFALRLPTGVGPARFSRAVDVPGALLILATLTLGVYAIVGVGHRERVHTLSLGVVAVALLGAFVVRQLTARSPLVPRQILRGSAPTANAIHLITLCGFAGWFVLASLHLQALGYRPFALGLAFLPVVGTIGIVSLGLTVRLVAYIGTWATIATGHVAMIAGLFYFATPATNTQYVLDILPTMVLVGMGAGLAFPPLMTLALSAATQTDTGAASGLNITCDQVGSAIGVAVLTTVASIRTRSLLDDGAPLAVAVSRGHQLAFVVAAAFIAVALALVLVAGFAQRGARVRLVFRKHSARESGALQVLSRLALLSTGHGSHVPRA